MLVRPARAANVAASCRAMKNMGLRALCLVDPAPGLDAPEARALAYGAWDVLDEARRAASLREAVSSSTLVAATTGRAVAGAVSPRQFAAEAAALSRPGTLSLVFGPEASGLTGAELALCQPLVHVPTAAEQPSLNLAQAVLILAYELRLAGLGTLTAADEGQPRPAASAGELGAALDDLRRALVDIGYLDPAGGDRILTELRRFVARAGPSPREVNLLRGLARQMSWAGRVARGRSPNA